MSKYGFLFDSNRCIQCRACEAACKQWNKVVTGEGVRWRRVYVREHGSFPYVDNYGVSLSCGHCDAPACVAACPSGAMAKRQSDGIVLVDGNKCVGCRYCVWACPYGAPQYNPVTRKTEKCIMCAHRLETGCEPACVSTCPTGALTFGLMEEIDSQGSAEIEEYADPSLTQPSVRFVKPGRVNY